MKKIITLLLLGWLVTFSSTAQVVYNVSPSSTNADNGETIFVDVTVENFVDMIGFQFEMEWNDAVLQFQNITTHGNIMCNVGGNPSVCYTYPSAFGPATITDFYVTQYLDPDFVNPTPNTLQDGDKLLTIEFLVVGSAGQSSPIDFRTSEAILAINSNFDELSFNNGMLSINNGSVNVNGTGCAGTGAVTFTASDEMGDTGTSGSVKVSVDNFENVEGFGYTVNWDPSIISFDSIGGLNLSGLVNPAPPAVGSFGTSQAINGDLFVSWSNASGVTACDGQVIFEIFYTINGAGQTSTDVDFTGNIEVIRNSQLVPHAVNSGLVNVTGNGGGLNGITFIAEDATGDNGSQVCVPFKVANFDQVISAQFEMTWDPTIMTYNSIVDGAGQPLSPIGAGNPLGLLNPTPPAIGNFGTTNTSNGIISFSWDNGSGVTLTDQTPVYQVCYDIIGTAGDVSPVGFTGTIEVADVNGLAVFNGVPGDVTVTGTFSGLNLEWDCCEDANPGENICVDVRVVDGFSNILSLQYGMLWDNSVLTFESIAFGNGNPLGLSVGNNLVYDANADAVKLLWFDNLGQGVDLPAGTSLYQVCFDATGSVNSNTDLEMGPIPTALPPFSVEVSNTQNTINFLGNSCNVTVTNILPISITETVTNPTCVGDTDGAIDITVSGGVEAYTYAWSTTATSEDISGLAAGNYTVTITDCKGVTAEKTITVTDPGAVSITGNVTNVSGAGNDGAIDITGTGGTGGLSYVWSTGSTNEDLTGLTIGTYTVTATDGNGCTGSETFTVANACTTITVTGTITHESSAGNDGAINASASGGIGTYDYSWDPDLGTSSGSVSNLAAGIYNVTATDDNGCTGIASFTVDPFNCPAVTATASGTNVTCAGGNDGSATANGGGGIAPYTYAWSNGDNTQTTTSGLSAGTYTVTATDVDGCFATTTVTINDGATIGINTVNTSNLTCFENNTGSITIEGTGGSGSYSATWQPGNMSGLTISNLAAGSYTPTITDTNTGCTAVGTAITLTQPTDISISGTATNASCNGGSDGSIALNITGGTPQYSVTWSNGGNGQNLPAGTYTPTVTDANGCVKIGPAITVGQPAPITAIETITNASCFGECDGTISLNVSGGTAGYTINWSNGATGPIVTGLCAGNISVTIIDANGCTFSDIYMVTQPAAFDLTFIVTPESTVVGDGAINLTVSPTGNYSYLWSAANDPNFSETTEDINNLVADVYTVIVTDNNSGCSTTGSEAVTNSLGIQSGIVTDATCNGECDGSIVVTTVGGDAPYNWLWSNNESSESIFGLCAGDYTLTITDAMGVVLIETYTVGEPPAIEITNVSITNESDICDGAINITAIGGTGTLTYAWSNGADSPDIDNLCEGDYNVTITDANGCIFVSPDYTVEPSSPQVGNVDITDASCFGDCDGKICISIVGGNAPYTVLNTTNNTSQVSTATTVCFAGLCPGQYDFIITDAQGLVVNAGPYTVDEPSPIAITNVIITHQSPSVCDGKIDITASGGTGNLSYEWSNGADNADPENLCMGTYNVTITDANGCIFVSPEYTVSKLTEITFDVTPVDCFEDPNPNGAIDVTVIGGFPSFTYVWTDASGTFITNNQDISNQPAGDYTLVITDGMNVEIFNGTINIGQPASAVSVVSTSVTQPTAANCSGGAVEIVAGGGVGGYTYEWVDANGNLVGTTPTITGLVGGMYFLTITDANGCTTTAQSELEECEIILLTLTDASPFCHGEANGEIGVIGDGGTEPYTYEWSNNVTETGVDGSVITDLPAGTYEVIVTDANGVSTTGTYEIIDPDPIQVTINTFPGRAEAIVLGGTAPYTYQWDAIITADPFIEGLQGGIQHVLMVTDDNGCTSELEYFDLGYNTDCYEAREVISPNNDGLNDNFFVNCVEDTKVKVIIFNRWGQEVYQNDDYDNSFKGIGRRDSVLPEGGYFYILEYQDGSGATQTRRGSLSIVR